MKSLLKGFLSLFKDLKGTPPEPTGTTPNVHINLPEYHARTTWELPHSPITPEEKLEWYKTKCWALTLENNGLRKEVKRHPNATLNRRLSEATRKVSEMKKLEETRKAHRELVNSTFSQELLRDKDKQIDDLQRQVKELKGPLPELPPYVEPSESMLRSSCNEDPHEIKTQRLKIRIHYLEQCVSYLSTQVGRLERDRKMILNHKVSYPSEGEEETG